MLSYIGKNLKRIRRELGISRVKIGKLLGVSPTAIYWIERQGLRTPPWVEYLEIYKNHPDLRNKNMILEIFKTNLLEPDNSEIYRQLEGLYGRESLRKELDEKTNYEILRDLADKNIFKWGEDDINCIRWRLGLIRKVGRPGDGEVSHWKKKK